MTDQYRATPNQWFLVEDDDNQITSCILELRARVEALEAAQRPVNWHMPTSPPPRGPLKAVVGGGQYSLTTFSDKEEGICGATIHSSTAGGGGGSAQPAPTGLLVERVGKAILLSPFDLNEGDNNSARAAIREMAAWLEERTGTIANGSQWADMLRAQSDQ